MRRRRGCRAAATVGAGQRRGGGRGWKRRRNHEGAGAWRQCPGCSSCPRDAMQDCLASRVEGRARWWHRRVDSWRPLEATTNGLACSGAQQQQHKQRCVSGTSSAFVVHHPIDWSMPLRAAARRAPPSVARPACAPARGSTRRSSTPPRRRRRPVSLVVVLLLGLGPPYYCNERPENTVVTVDERAAPSVEVAPPPPGQDGGGRRRNAS